MPKIDLMNLGLQNGEIFEDLKNKITQVIKSNSFINGQFNQEFTNQFSSMLNIKHSIGVANGTDALEIAIESLNIEKGSNILVPVNSFVASAESVIRSGLIPNFCRFNHEDLNICINDILKNINSKTKAIMAVHLYGRPADLINLNKICKEFDLFLIEDCAQAHFAEINGKYTGTFGDVAAFSFYPGKNLGALGDAGLIATNNDELADKARKIANHGRIKKFDHDVVGRNSRLDEIQAAILSVKLKKILEWTKRRKKVASYYYKSLEKIPFIQIPKIHDGNSYHLFPMITGFDRNSFRKILKDSGIATGLHYPKLIPEYPPYKKFSKNNFDDLIEINNKIFTIPMHENLSISQAEFVVKKIIEATNELSSSP